MQMMRQITGLTVLLLMCMLAACNGGGQYDGRPSGQHASDDADNGSFTEAQSFFTARVQPGLDFCRTCHVPGGVADTEKGDRFMLSRDGSDDYAATRAAWQALSEGVEDNRILTKASNTDAEPHSGGAPWPKGSAPYLSMRTLLACWDDPAGCAELLGSTGGNGSGEDTFPLLGSRHAGHPWFDFCEGKPGDTALPPDPRTLVQPGVSEGKAVTFNSYWQSCATLDGPEFGHPETCGELRDRYALGKRLMEGNGTFGAATLLAGDKPEGGLLAMTAADYNNLWRDAWRLPSRPDNFDQLVAERYGLPIGEERNPYPLPGEDPASTDGGSGQLPIGLTQGHNADGSYNGNISITCLACHGSQVGRAGDGPGLGGNYSGGNTGVEIQLMLAEMLRGKPLNYLVVGANKTRGVSQFPIQLGMLLTANIHPEDLNLLGMMASPSSGDNDPPPWWNIAYKLSKFHSGFVPIDNLRTFLLADMPVLDGSLVGTNIKEAKAFVRDNGPAVDAWILAQEPPAWPWGYCANADGTPGPGDDERCINRPLAEAGAVLFHSKDLWAQGLDNPVPQPQGGNGSCAGCHGAYSPRYANDPGYLATPALSGIAAYIAPHEVIGADTAYADATSSQAFIDYFNDHDFYAYADKDADEQGCGFVARHGYQTPPLHGIWASAPYMHNGAVPTVWQMLKPSDRPEIWRRISTPVREDQSGQVVMGFDTDLERVYDADELGWKYEPQECGGGTLPYVDCTPLLSQVNLLLEPLLQAIYGNIWFTFNVTQPPVTFTTEQLEQRKIYNTQSYGHGRQGHEFTVVLTDAERRALIEYLKTL